MRRREGGSSALRKGGFDYSDAAAKSAVVRAPLCGSRSLQTVYVNLITTSRDVVFPDDFLPKIEICYSVFPSPPVAVSIGTGWATPGGTSPPVPRPGAVLASMNGTWTAPTSSTTRTVTPTPPSAKSTLRRFES